MMIMVKPGIVRRTIVCFATVAFLSFCLITVGGSHPIRVRSSRSRTSHRNLLRERQQERRNLNHNEYNYHYNPPHHHGGGGSYYPHHGFPCPGMMYPVAIALGFPMPMMPPSPLPYHHPGVLPPYYSGGGGYYGRSPFPGGGYYGPPNGYHHPYHYPPYNSRPHYPYPPYYPKPPRPDDDDDYAPTASPVYYHSPTASPVYYHSPTASPVADDDDDHDDGDGDQDDDDDYYGKEDDDSTTDDDEEDTTPSASPVTGATPEPPTDDSFHNSKAVSLTETSDGIVTSSCENTNRPVGYLDLRKQILAPHYIVCFRNEDIIGDGSLDPLKEYLSDFFVDVLIPKYVEYAVDCDFTESLEVVAVVADRKQTGTLAAGLDQGDGTTCYSWINARFQINYYRQVPPSQRYLFDADATGMIGPNDMAMADQTADTMEMTVDSLPNGVGKDGSTITFRRPWLNSEDQQNDGGAPTDEGNVVESLQGDGGTLINSSRSTSANFAAVFGVVAACLFVLVVAFLAVRRRSRKQRGLIPDIDGKSNSKSDASTASGSRLGLVSEPEIGLEDHDAYYTDERFRDDDDQPLSQVDEEEEEEERNEDAPYSNPDGSSFNETVYIEDNTPRTPEAKSSEPGGIPRKENATPDPSGICCCAA